MFLKQLLVVFLFSIARTCDALRAVPGNNATAEGPSHAPAPKINMQFIQRAAFSELWFDPTNPAAPGTLTLKGISPHTSFYSTSPMRTAGIFATGAFVTRPQFFTNNQNASQWLGAPNAALISGSEGPYLADEVIILTIISASYNRTMDTMVYQVSLVMDSTGLSMASAGAGDTEMGRGMSRSAEWLMGKQPSQAAANRVQAATAAQEESYGPEQVDPVLRRVDVALHIGPWEVENMPQ